MQHVVVYFNWIFINLKVPEQPPAQLFFALGVLGRTFLSYSPTHVSWYISIWLHIQSWYISICLCTQRGCFSTLEWDLGTQHHAAASGAAKGTLSRAFFFIPFHLLCTTSAQNSEAQLISIKGLNLIKSRNLLSGIILQGAEFVKIPRCISAGSTATWIQSVKLKKHCHLLFFKWL